LLALNDASTASRVAVEIRDADKTRLALQQASQPVSVDAQGMQHCRFMPIILPLQITLSPDEPMRMPPL
jgi:type 1 fimbria pilin